MKRIAIALLFVALVGIVPIVASCRQESGSSDSDNAASENVLWRNELFDYAADALLNRMDEYYSAERQQQTINRLDQWVRMQPPLDDWSPDPVIAGVTEDLRAAAEQMLQLAQHIDELRQGTNAKPPQDLPDQIRSISKRLDNIGMRLALMDILQTASQLISLADQLETALNQNATVPSQTNANVRQALSQLDLQEFQLRAQEYLLLAQRMDPSLLEFHEMDSPAFQQAVWLRNVASWASGEELDDPVKPAAALFDWVVKNVDLVREPPSQDGTVRVLQTPVETLLFGQGTGIDRAWLFVLLARQINIDAALLGLVDENDKLNRLWGVGVLIEGKIYLFEPVLGLPVPKPDSMKLNDNGLALEPATLAEAAADPAVLEQLCVYQKGDYSVEAKDMQRIVALVEASPAYLSQRMKMVENRLAGDQKIVLTTDATAQIDRFKQSPQIAHGRMWPIPYQTMWQEIRLGSKRRQWLNARLTPFLFPPTMPLLWKARSYHFNGQFTGNPSATMFYQAARRSEFSMDSDAADPQTRQLWREIKLDATYWLGLMVAQQANYRAARDYLETRVLDADPLGKWEYGATYNLARIAEATNDAPAAIQLYERHSNAPQIQGNLVRARWLRQLTGQSVPELLPRKTDKDDETTPPAPATSESKSDEMKKTEEPSQPETTEKAETTKEKETAEKTAKEATDPETPKNDPQPPQETSPDET